MRFIELLAPARDLQTGIEALKHGADAVYIGAPKFGARAAAGNSVEDIAELVRHAHTYKAKVYVTLNTILYDNELQEISKLIEELTAIGVDALIVQDMATLSDDKRQIPLHASTQMDNRTAEKVAWLRDLGFEQVVLARELTLEEIEEIHRRVPDVRLEVFVHGAICVSYNGQCYASQYCFGRSANRGECAQFCRMPFDLIEERDIRGKEQVLVRQKHLLSLRDMNRSNDLEALLDAGASSLKIEGRLKDVSYVKNVVAYYRQQLDEIIQRRPQEYRRSSIGRESIAFTPNPAKSFNRLFTDYFMHGRTRNMANIHTPKSMGEPIESAEIHNGDGLCYINEHGQLEGFRVNRVEELPRFMPQSPLTLYRNHDQEFEKQLAKPTATRKVGVCWLLKESREGEFLLRLTREDGVSAERTFVLPCELARSPQTEPITRQLSRLGDTPYEATGVDIKMSQNWFIPGSVLAEWRRKLVESLARRVENNYPAQRLASPSSSSNSPFTDLTYLANVANHKARQFYLCRGANRVDWAMEVAPKEAGHSPLIMTCRYCIRYELGMCNKVKRVELRGKNEEGERLCLRLADGRRFRLRFDCRKCQMEVYAE